MGLGCKVLGTGISTNYHLAIASANNEPPHPPNKTYFPDYIMIPHWRGVGHY